MAHVPNLDANRAEPTSISYSFSAEFVAGLGLTRAWRG